MTPSLWTPIQGISMSAAGATWHARLVRVSRSDAPSMSVPKKLADR